MGRVPCAFAVAGPGMSRANGGVMIDCCLRYVDMVDEAEWTDRQVAAGRTVEAYLARAAAYIRETPSSPRSEATGGSGDSDDVLRILLRRDFNYQSNGRIAHLIPDLAGRIAQVMREGRPVPIFYLYHGGYRASTDGALDRLTFLPDATEMLMIYQIARLRRALADVYPPGVRFSIVINDGVAARTNDIPHAATRHYVDRLRDMIGEYGGDDATSVLVQSEVVAPAAVASIENRVSIDDIGHRVVERFLGRACSLAEAEERASRYVVEEQAWARDVGRIVDEVSGFCMRQIAHPACLSFRPFPGGAIRVQNGAVGFTLRGDDRDPVPFLVTSATGGRRELLTVPIRWTTFRADRVLAEQAA